MLAVSQKVMPSSTACRKIGSRRRRRRAHGIRGTGSPKLMQPSAIRLTLRPDDPSRTYSITVPCPFFDLPPSKPLEAVANQALLIHALTGPVTSRRPGS